MAKATDASGSRVRCVLLRKLVKPQSSYRLSVGVDAGGLLSGSNLRWSFGNSLKGLRFGYSMKFIPDSTGSFLQWQYGGASHECCCRQNIWNCR